jgi:hypothetical protein
VTLEEAKALRQGQTVYHCSKRNADGTPVRARVNGKIKLWKRDPYRLQIPMKQGMYYAGFYLEHGGRTIDSYNNLGQWSLDEDRAKHGCVGKQPRKQKLVDLGRGR